MCTVQALGLRVPGVGLRPVEGLGFRVQSLGLTEMELLTGEVASKPRPYLPCAAQVPPLVHLLNVDSYGCRAQARSSLV